MQEYPCRQWGIILSSNTTDKWHREKESNSLLFSRLQLLTLLKLMGISKESSSKV